MSQHPGQPPQTDTLDRIGAGGSLLCAVHCAVGPLLLAVLPTTGIGLLWSEGFEAVFTVFASLLGLTSLWIGYRRHRSLRAWPFLLAGLALLWAEQVFPELHGQTWTHAIGMTLGGSLVAAGHLVNLRLGHRAPAAAAG